jgi:hypothetical protein
VSNGPWWTMDQHKRWWMLESGQSRYWTKVDGTWYYLGIDNKMYDLNDGDTGFYLHTDGRIWKNFDDGEWTIDVNDIWWKWEDGAGGTNKLWVDVDINTGVKDWWWMEYDTTNKKLYDINDVEKGVLREDLRIEKESLGVPLVLYSNRIGGRKWLAQVGDRFCSNSGGFSWCLDDKYHWWKRDGGSDWLKIDEEWFIKEEDKWWVIVDSNSLSDESHGFYWGDNTGRWIPVPGNYYDSYYKSHKASDLTIYDSSTGEWWVKNLKHLAIEGYEWGNGVSFIPVPGDYNGEVLASLCEVEGEVRSVSCGEGICAGNTGQESCSGGQWGESTCNPFEGSLFEICSNSHNEDCDSEVDEPDCLDISDYHEKVFCNYPINRLYIDYEITEPDHSNTEYITYLGMSDAVIINWWFEMGITTTGAEAQEERFILCVASYLASQIPNDPNDPDGPGGPGGPGGSGGDNPGDGVTTCTYFYYSEWGECSSSGTRTRTITSSAPLGCEGGIPVLSEQCTYIPLCTETDWSYSISPTECPFEEEQIKTWTKIGQCEEGVIHETGSITCEYEAPICSDFTYSDWAECTSSGTQGRNISSSAPENCEGGTSINSQSCDYIPLCTESDWGYSIYPMECPPDEEQTKTWAKLGQCENGVNPETESITCEYEIPICSDFTYSDWSECLQSNAQSRTVTSISPENCEGGTPTTSQSCTYIPLCTEADWSFSILPIECPSYEKQIKAWNKIGRCEKGVNHIPETIICEYEAPTCSDFTYSDWTICTSSGTQFRTLISSLPSGCEGGISIISQSCDYVPLCTEADWSYSISPTKCPSDEEQTKTWTKIGQCEEGVNHETGPITCEYEEPTCSNFNYSDWTICTSSGTQYREVVSSLPFGCEGGTPITSQSCTYVPLCTDADWNYSISPRECPSDEEQIKTWTKIGRCEKGVNHETGPITCDYNLRRCTSFSYTSWRNCLQSNIQSRTILSRSPENCEGGTPITSQSCTYVPLCTDADWNYSISPRECPSDEEQIKTWTKIGQCEMGVNHNLETISCSYQIPSCTNFTYSMWGACTVSRTRIRRIISSLPSGCEGGVPVISQSCRYMPVFLSPDSNMEDTEQTFVETISESNQEIKSTEQELEKPEKQTPSEPSLIEQKSPLEKKDSNILLYSVGSILSLGALGGISFFIYLKITAHLLFRKTLQHHSTLKLEKYIRQMLMANYDKETLRKTILKKGWNKKVADYLLKHIEKQ